MQDEFGDLYYLNKDLIYKYLLKLCNFEESLAEELVQETFYQAMISFHKYRGECKVETWLCKIAQNVAFKYFRKYSMKKTGEMYAKKQLEITEYQDVPSNPEYYMERKEINSYVRTCILKIKKKYREVIIYRIYYELSYTEIAKILHMNETAVRVNYHRGKEELRKELEEYLYG